MITWNFQEERKSSCRLARSEAQESKLDCQTSVNIQENMLHYPSHSSNQTALLVGIESRLDDLNSHMGIEQEDVRIVGICGMGGIGKTTLARSYFRRMSSQFDGVAFLANVREVASKTGLLSLQEDLLLQILKEKKKVKIWNLFNGMDLIRRRLHSKRVLIVMDDVDQSSQLHHLAGSTDWFGLGSRIIVTSRDQHLLLSHGVDNIYRAKGLNDFESLHLLSLKAFNNSHPPPDYLKLSTAIVHYADGLPLAIEVLGSFLVDKTLDEWRSVLERMKRNPEKRIFDTLQISFDGLEETEKQIFLDIACFFKGKKKDRVMRIMESCDFYPDIGIRVLIDKSLISIDIVGGKLKMHDLLQEMGWKIVRQESLNEPGKRSRIWLYDDIFHVCTRNSGTEEVEGIVLDLPNAKEALCAEAFVKLKKLRLLELRNMHFFADLKYLSNDLRFFKWHGYPFENFPSNFQSKKLVEMIMCHSHTKQLWNGVKEFSKLKIMKLSHSKNLVQTPDFRGSPNLEKLVLEGCTELQEIDQSVGVLQRLVVLNLKDCKKLSSVPNNIYGLKALKTLNLSGCLNLDYSLEGFGHLEGLESLDLSGTTTKKPSAAVSLFNNLKMLTVSGCKNERPLSFLPELGFCSLQWLDLSDCDLQEEMIPKDLSSFSSLLALSLSRNDFKSLPGSINTLPALQDLYLDDCKMLQSLQVFPSNLQYVTAQGCTSLETLPDMLDLCSSQSSRLNLSNCFKLVDNQGHGSFISTILRKYLQVCLSSSGIKDQSSLTVPELFDSRPKFEFVFPGSEIPEWFSHQILHLPDNFESSISIQLSPEWIDCDWMGVAICCVFRTKDRDTSSYYDLDLTCEIQMKNHTWTRSLDSHSISTVHQLDSDHIWLLYWSPFEFSGITCRDITKLSSHFEVSFASHGQGLFVKKWGVQVAHEQRWVKFKPNNESNVMIEEQ